MSVHEQKIMNPIIGMVAREVTDRKDRAEKSVHEWEDRPTR